ncbi:MAG: response regulator [Asticcacaulis sp.]|uniref:response regulator n=1 Tax=Asticcacaulis sp. TaxID=1872648 RepID=UPI0039E40FC8
MSDYVLILEDSKTQAHIVGGLFEKCGLIADYAHDINSAIKKLGQRGYSLIVLDVFVGVDNTLDHLPRLRKLAPNAPVAIMTAGRRDQPLAASQALNQARRAKVDFLLPKPFSLEDIRQVVEETQYIRRHRRQFIKVLIIDDDTTTRMIYRSYLENEGYFISESSSVEEALGRLDITRVDLVLTDLVMDGIGGLAGIRIISSTWPDVPIIAMTGYTREGDALQSAVQKGAALALAKPFGQDQLLEAVNKCLHKPEENTTYFL